MPLRLTLDRYFKPFSVRNYRLFFSGQIVSLLGTWMTQTATVWLVYHLTSSPVWLGLVALAGQLPMLLLAPIAGVLVDRVNRHRLLIATQIFSMLQSFALAGLTLSGHINITALLVLSFLQGVINAIDMPARQALPILLVEKKEDLAGVIGLNSSMFNVGRLAGPACAGFIITAVGTGYCFLIDACSYLAVIAALLLMHLRPQAPPPPIDSIWGEFRKGLDYALGFGPIRRLIFLTGCMSLFGLSFSVLMPMYAREIFRGDARTLGILMSSSAAGALLAALYLAGRKSLRGLGRVITFGGTLMGLALYVFAFSRLLPLSMLCLLLAGLGGVLLIASNNTLVQNLVDEDKRGRVMSLFGIAFLGGMPLGSLLTGTVAGKFGACAATCLNATACLVLAWLFHRSLPALRQELRPLLLKAGLLNTEPPLPP